MRNKKTTYKGCITLHQIKKKLKMLRIQSARVGTQLISPVQWPTLKLRQSRRFFHLDFSSSMSLLLIAV